MLAMLRIEPPRPASIMIGAIAEVAASMLTRLMSMWLRQLRSLGAKFYACGPSMDHFNVPRDKIVFPDVPVVEYLTFMTVMRDADVQLFVQ